MVSKKYWFSRKRFSRDRFSRDWFYRLLKINAIKKVKVWYLSNISFFGLRIIFVQLSVNVSQLVTGLSAAILFHFAMISLFKIYKIRADTVSLKMDNLYGSMVL